jgi:hypothetical protein
VKLPAIPFDHLLRLSDGTGLFEHAELTRPRREHGYCVDDVARGLRVAVLQPDPPEPVTRLAGIYLRFLADAQTPDGRFHNRRDVDLVWTDEPGLDDCWGRALWALGTVVAHGPAELAHEAGLLFELGARQRCRWPRAMAFAALGAADVLHAHPGQASAAALLADASRLIPPLPAGDWGWPEPRLRYANAVLPEVVIAAGFHAGDSRRLGEGLAMLSWLLDVQTVGDHLSVAPVAGWADGEPRPGFDQQPIEVAALADACTRAFEFTGERHWADAVLRCADWFLGANDSGTALYDPVSGGGCDGLEPHGRNENQGAESTIAMISTFQQAHQVLAARR